MNEEQEQRLAEMEEAKDERIAELLDSVVRAQMDVNRLRYQLAIAKRFIIRAQFSTDKTTGAEAAGALNQINAMDMP